jgi:hypothetical protein
MLLSGWKQRALRTNIAVVTINFLYGCTLIRFGSPLTIVTNQGINFINDAIKYLTNHCLLKHVNSTTYYLQVESTNKVLGTLLTKLISENKINWDEHLSTMLFSYIIVDKVTTWYTPYQLVYELHPLMPIKYILQVVGGNERDNTSMRVLTRVIVELEKL